LIAPHIDLERGLVTYARAYGVLRDLGKVDRFVVLGTSHGPMTQLLAPTRKDYETPLGPARTDREAIDRVASVLGEDAFDDEFSHKNEHSIEFQTIFLKLIHPEAEIVPLLCGSLRASVDDDTDPAGNPEVERAAEAVRAAIDDGKKTVVVAAADLAHVGPRFGGPKLSHELLSETEAGDRRALDFAAARDAAGWYRAVTEGGDPRNTCGLAPIYWLLRALDRGRGHLISYRRCEAPDQCVTIGAMAFLDGDFIPPDALEDES
jgi:AmmeMemoRadiSam system protein B